MSRRCPLPQILVLALVSTAALHTWAPAVAHAADTDKPKPTWRTEKHILEVGGYLGVLFPAADHGLYADGITKSAKPIKPGFAIGLRIAYLPLRFVGVELEGGPSFAKLDGNGGFRTTLFAVRAHVILQMPTRLALFVVGGGGMLGVSSDAKALGSSIDGAMHVGGGLKYYLTPKVVLRIDGRDIVSPNFSKGMPGGQDWAHNGEFTFGASFVLGRKSTRMLPRG